MLLKVCIFGPILVAYLNLGESCTVKKKIQIVVSDVFSQKENPVSETCRCGMVNRKKVESRIANGEDTEKNEYPWMVALSQKIPNNTEHEFFFCGGSIISSKTILTAAHCLDMFDLIPGATAYVEVGQHKRKSLFSQRNVIEKDDGVKLFEVCTSKAHPKYKNDTIDYDYGVVTLCDELTWSREVSPVCLPDPDVTHNKYDNKPAIVSGWGKDNVTDFEGLPLLQELTMNILTADDCKLRMCSGNWKNIKEKLNCDEFPSRIMCAKTNERYKTTCQGDSGGPLIFNEGGREAYTQIGIASFGKCGVEDLPTGFARVTEELDWIKANMEGSTCK